MPTTTSLDSLQQRRAQNADQIAALGDLRSGSITPTSGRCGKPTCHCHRPNDPGHGPNPRLTFKVVRKTVTQSLPNPAAVHKAGTGGTAAEPCLRSLGCRRHLFPPIPPHPGRCRQFHAGAEPCLRTLGCRKHLFPPPLWAVSPISRA